jgi:transcriptional regulator with XRE-family HTH domain
MREKALATVHATRATASGVGSGAGATPADGNTGLFRFYQDSRAGCLGRVPREPVEPAFWQELARYLTSNVRALRERAGWTQSETAERAGIDPKHMQAIEAGSGNVTLRTLAALSSAFGVEPARLLQPAPAVSPRRRGRPPKRAPVEYTRSPEITQLHDAGPPETVTTTNRKPRRPS